MCMEWSRYKALCDQPDYWSRWMLEQCIDVFETLQEGELAAQLEQALTGAPLAVPADHKNHPATHMFQLNLPAPSRIAAFTAIETAIAQGVVTPQTRSRGLGGFAEAWQEYADYYPQHDSEAPSA